MVGGGRPRLMAFLSFLLEMYCQLRRRAIQRRGASAQPGQVLLTLICKCCEDCIRQPVPSASDVSIPSAHLSVHRSLPKSSGPWSKLENLSALKAIRSYLPPPPLSL